MLAGKKQIARVKNSELSVTESREDSEEEQVIKMYTKAFEREFEGLGAFEISADMLKIAKNNVNDNTFLNAGRGNPNWINTKGRLAFCRIMEFGVSESSNSFEMTSLAGYTKKRGIAKRLEDFLNPNEEADKFLLEAVDYVSLELGVDKDEFVKELTDAILGNNYPVPSRCLSTIEKILAAFLESIMLRDTGLAKSTRIFPTEGGTAAIVYIFDSLKHNGLLNEGDKIAINIPIFTPYIQIPKLTNFDFFPINVSSSEENNWQITKDDIEKLKDPAVKAFFLVNPSNPGSHALDEETLDCLGKLIKERPDLMIITDDVYGTFAEDFKSVYAIAPRNTLLVYSFSKLYGATGWRTGMVAINENNIFDKLIEKLPQKKKDVLQYDYSIVSTNPDEMKFIDRMCADSRSIGLYHTSGLSTPQQGMMALFALSHLVEKGEDPYFEESKQVIATRYGKLYHALGLKEDNSPTNTKYYSLINIYQLAGLKYGEEFENYLKDKFDGEEFMIRLAQEEGVVLMMGEGFGAMEGTLRVSEANLTDDQYELVGYRVLKILEDYHIEYEKLKEDK